MTSNIWQVPDPTADLDGLQTSSKGTFGEGCQGCWLAAIMQLHALLLLLLQRVPEGRRQ